MPLAPVVAVRQLNLRQRGQMRTTGIARQNYRQHSTSVHHRQSTRDIVRIMMMTRLTGRLFSCISHK